MKKALAILMIFALVASVAVAEVSIGAWGRGIFVPVQNSGADDADNMTSIQKTWEGMATNSEPRIKFSVNGNSDNVGFQFEINNDGAAVGKDGQQKIWVKPVDMVTVVMGRYFEDTLRGNTAFGSFDWIRAYGNDNGEDITFTRICSGADNKNWNSTPTGFLVTARPVDAVFVAVNLADAYGLTEDLFNKVQVQFGYDIDGIGLFRAQYFSRDLAGDADGTIEVAFKLTMVENLYADFGFRMFTNDDVGALGAAKEKDVSAYAKYSMDAIVLHAQTIFKLMDDDNAYTFGAGVDYDMGDGIGVQGDVHYFNDIWDKAGNGETAFTFFAGVKKGFSNGLIGAGVQVLSAEDTAWAIPVRMEYWF